MLCAGAFPGFSNVLAVEAAATLGAPVKDLAFNYFTAGLGGSGVVNLDITNYGFGPPVARYVDGAPAKTEAFAGEDLGEIDYFFPGGDENGLTAEGWAWPFPEAATVAEELGISGTSRAGMGTAPAIWNVVLRAMVAVGHRAAKIASTSRARRGKIASTSRAQRGGSVASTPRNGSSAGRA